MYSELNNVEIPLGKLLKSLGGNINEKDKNVLYALRAFVAKEKT